MPLPTPWKTASLIGLIGLVTLLGVAVRLEDPASSRVIPAEDPYTHMTLVRNHLADGRLDPLVDSGELYPPGMHAVLAAFHVFTGLDLDLIFRFGPVVFGAVGIIGIALVLWRSVGPLASVVGSLAVALAPEMVFRTTMMAPTAVDLALLPFLLLGVLELLRGRLLWVAPVAAVFLYLMLAHPWIVLILAPVALGTVLLAAVLGRGVAARPVTAAGAGMVLALSGLAVLVSTSICRSSCGLGFQDVGAGTSRLDHVAGLIGFLNVAFAAALLWQAKRRGRATLLPGIRLASWARASLAITAALTVAATTMAAASAGWPEHVDLPRMFGWPLLVLAGVGLVMTPMVRWRAAWPATALCVTTYPFVIFNPLDSPFWPHRTAAFLGIGLALLAGLGAAAVMATAMALARRLAARRTARTPARMRTGIVLGLLVATFTAGSVYAGTPPTYETGWYRLYHECEFDAIQDLASSMDDSDVLITGDWRGKLVAAAFAPEARNVWYAESFFMDADHRERTSVGLAVAGQEMRVLIDRHVTIEHPEYDLTFLQSDEWQLESAHCDEGLGTPRLLVYRSVVVP